MKSVGKIKCSSVDLLAEKIEFVHMNKRFVARWEGPEVYILTPDEGRIVGRIYLGGQSSGAIYHGRDCIAEFDKSGKKYVIRPVFHGRRELEHKLECNPVDYFFARLHDLPG